ncbi:O-methyltransferase [Paenibacillus prosopidis]|uniref:Methyltransferase family protein n=1 Tax=Paenibacillus prosopidis TaxID=630520 RepID=A0A368W7P3_9BACL|nr:class I SAM-dependent methyltransferase [Paenibacillus prosopidis]RCW50869.1 methyltransferase family protein [Paenibacillus prosopidis]
MNTTDLLLSLDPTLKLHSESEWVGVEEAKLYSAFNSGGIECETGEFLYGFVRLLKPEWVLETGTHYATGASYMGMALKDNGKGKLDTIEFLRPIHEHAVERIHRMGLQNQVNLYCKDVKDFDPGEKKYKLILLDTEPQTRFAEFIKFYDYLEEGGFIFIHDLHRHLGQEVKDVPGIPNQPYWPWGEIPGEIVSLVKYEEIRPFHFATPRGLAGFYKTHPSDYKWI